MRKPALIPTMPWHKRQCPEDHCIDWTYVLSVHKRLYGKQNDYPVYECTVKWKCSKGHRSDTKKLVDMDGVTIEEG